MTATDARRQMWMAWAATGAAVALAARRVPLDYASYALLHAKAALNPESMGADLLVRAAGAVPYALGSRVAAWGMVSLHSLTGASPETAAGAFQLLLWTLQGLLMFRLVRAVSGSANAAFLGTLCFGLDMPLLFADTPYCMPEFDRSLGLVPLLWAVCRLVEGEPWPALLGLSAATYVHANPAIQLWPLFFLEDVWRFAKNPEHRAGVVLRLAVGLVIALPLCMAAGEEPFLDAARDYARTTLIVSAAALAGLGNSAQVIFTAVAGSATIALLLRFRPLPSTGLWLRGIAAACVMMAMGRVAYLAYDGSPLWGFILKLQPWVSMHVVEWAGDILLAAWLGSLLEAEDPFWLGALCLFAYPRGPFVRFAALAVCWSLLTGRRRVAAAVFTAAVVAPILHWTCASTLQAALGLLRLELLFGYITAEPPYLSAGIVACLTAAYACLRMPKDRYRPACLVAAAAAVLCASWLQDVPSTDHPFRRMESWAKANTPPGSKFVFSPLGLGDCMGFIIAAERPASACLEYLDGILLFGRHAAPMGERMRDLGFDFAAVKEPEDVRAAVDRLNASLDLRAASRLGYRPDYLLTSRAETAAAPVHREGPYLLYRVPTP
ncbi:MAG: hypothetical protein HY078_14810 [Elusimicrobia bacterium]|nr:hypothetical protein [Elusimicrobiota bacterium]